MIASKLRLYVSKCVTNNEDRFPQSRPVSSEAEKQSPKSTVWFVGTPSVINRWERSSLRFCGRFFIRSPICLDLFRNIITLSRQLIGGVWWRQHLSKPCFSTTVLFNQIKWYYLHKIPPWKVSKIHKAETSYKSHFGHGRKKDTMYILLWLKMKGDTSVWSNIKRWQSLWNNNDISH